MNFSNSLSLAHSVTTSEPLCSETESEIFVATSIVPIAGRQIGAENNYFQDDI